MNLSSRLQRDSRAALKSSIELYLNNADRAAAVVLCATATELLMKAVLAHVNPALVAEPRHARSTAWFADITHDEADPPDWIRSVTAEGASDLLTHLAIAGWNSATAKNLFEVCLLYTSPSPRDS